MMRIQTLWKIQVVLLIVVLLGFVLRLFHVLVYNVICCDTISKTDTFVIYSCLDALGLVLIWSLLIGFVVFSLKYKLHKSYIVLIALLVISIALLVNTIITNAVPISIDVLDYFTKGKYSEKRVVVKSIRNKQVFGAIIQVVGDSRNYYSSLKKGTILKSGVSANVKFLTRSRIIISYEIISNNK